MATASLEAANISFPFRKLFHGSKNVRIRITEVPELKLAEKSVMTDIGEFPYNRVQHNSTPDAFYLPTDKLRSAFDCADYTF
ncbi:MAG: hypothetical protein EOO00_03035 [Chitinophagaceae bacterium]|nr:MAG: hypothetical protein EOO00_03035 [Chitinophagaceae bacterium]